MYDECGGTALDHPLIRRLQEERDSLIVGLRRIARIQADFQASLAGEQSAPYHESEPERRDIVGRAQMAATAVVDLVSELLSNPPSLEVWVENHGDVVHLYLVGELDIATRGQSLTVMRSLVAAAPNGVVVHTEFLTFLDCAGVAPLVALANALSAEGVSVRVTGASTLQRKILSLTPVEFDD